jgi:hypothetical protein
MDLISSMEGRSGKCRALKPGRGLLVVDFVVVVFLLFCFCSVRCFWPVQARSVLSRPVRRAHEIEKETLVKKSTANQPVQIKNEKFIIVTNPQYRATNSTSYRPNNLASLHNDWKFSVSLHSCACEYEDERSYKQHTLQSQDYPSKQSNASQKQNTSSDKQKPEKLSFAGALSKPRHTQHPAHGGVRQTQKR